MVLAEVNGVGRRAILGTLPDPSLLHIRRGRFAFGPSSDVFGPFHHTAALSLSLEQNADSHAVDWDRQHQEAATLCTSQNDP